MSEIKSNKRILDIGCGTKPCENANIVMDLNPIINTLPDNIEKKIYDLNKTPYPFEDCSIDEINCSQLLEHLCIHSIDLFKECYRILKPNGRLILELPNAFFITARMKFLFGSYIEDSSYHPFHVKLLKPSYVKQLLRHIGFSVNFKRTTRLLYVSGLEFLCRDMFARGIKLVARRRP